ncbi:MAG: MFS transporter [Anaerolineae bacterium]|nr:MFS transporter [Anaerolineae bacterium]
MRFISRSKAGAADGSSLYYGWHIAFTLAITEMVSWGILFYAFSVVLKPLQTELGWDQGTITGAFSLALLVSGIAAIPVGRWLDRYGSRAIMTLGSCAGVVLVLAWSQVMTVPAFYAVWFLIGITVSTVLYDPAFTVVANWFIRKRAQALTIVTFGGGLASVVFVPLTERLVRELGWRPALMVLAVILALVTIPLHGLVLRRRPADVGLLPDGEVNLTPQPPLRSNREGEQNTAGLDEVNFGAAGAALTPSPSAFASGRGEQNTAGLDGESLKVSVSELRTKEGEVSFGVADAALTPSPSPKWRGEQDLSGRDYGTDQQAYLKPSEIGHPETGERSIPVSKAIRGMDFWWLALAFALSTFSAIAISVHLISYLTEQGFSTAFAAAAVGLVGGSQIPGRLVFTPLGNRVSRRLLTAGLFVMQGVALLILIGMPTESGVILFAIIFGSGSGASSPARAALLAERYGAAHYGSISGVQTLVMTMARATAPVGMGALVVATGSYQPVLWALVFTSAGAVLAMLMVRQTHQATAEYER